MSEESVKVSEDEGEMREQGGRSGAEVKDGEQEE